MAASKKPDGKGITNVRSNSVGAEITQPVNTGVSDYKYSDAASAGAYSRGQSNLSVGSRVGSSVFAPSEEEDTNPEEEKEDKVATVVVSQNRRTAQPSLTDNQETNDSR